MSNDFIGMKFQKDGLNPVVLIVVIEMKLASSSHRFHSVRMHTNRKRLMLKH